MDANDCMRIGFLLENILQRMNTTFRFCEGYLQDSLPALNIALDEALGVARLLQVAYRDLRRVTPSPDPFLTRPGPFVVPNPVEAESVDMLPTPTPTYGRGRARSLTASVCSELPRVGRG